MIGKFVKEKGLLLLVCLGFVLLIGLPNATTNVPISLVLGIVSIVLSLLYAYKRELISLEDVKFDWKRIGWIVFSFLLLYVVGELGDMVLAWEGIKETQNQLINDEAATHIPAYLDRFLTIFLAPITEEVLFRGVIPQLLFKNHQKVGYLVGAVLFGLVHGVTSVGEAVFYIGGGLVFALTCYRYGRMSDSIIIHMIHNAL